MYKNIILTLSITLLIIACTPKEDSSQTHKCYQLPNSGQCKAAFSKYYYDIQTDKCTKFIWGGCGGSVPFKTLQECQKVCE